MARDGAEWHADLERSVNDGVCAAGGDWGRARRPEPRVVALTGDGGLLMCAGELLTAARERLRVITVVLNDASLSLIEIKQQARRLRRRVWRSAA